MWGGYIMTMLSQDKPTLRAINPRTWIKQTDYPEQPFKTSLSAFTKQRNDLLATLEPLRPKDWSRSATITGAGKPLVLTMLSYAQRLAEHERPHLKQIARIANTMRQ
jgi:hypothetical protein